MTNKPASSPVSTVVWYQGWLPILLLPAIPISMFPPAWPRWAFMWSLSFAIYLGCKWLTWRRTPTTASIGRKFGYLFAWPGLDAAAFLHSSDDVAISRPDAKEWSLASLKLLCGVSLIWGVVRLIPTDSPYAAGWVGMIGLVMTLHFGIFHLLSCTWRTFGVNAPPLMDWPIASVSVSEFWGRRWNRAFRDLTHRFLFRPLTAKLGPRWALVVGFLFSGLVHDAVISYPAGGGYGGPTLFFMLQAAAMFVERSPRGRREGYGRGMKGRLFTIAVLITPVTLLFHRPFVLTIIVPFLEAMRVF